jgi:hypothetical protein
VVNPPFQAFTVTVVVQPFVGPDGELLGLPVGVTDGVEMGVPLGLTLGVALAVGLVLALLTR